MKTLHFEKHIEGSPEEIFALIADFANYHRWLSKSASFGKTSAIEPYPVCAGTTYVDAGIMGVRTGTVTEFEPCSTIAFLQPMATTGMPGRIDIAVRYTLAPKGTGTSVHRDLTLDIIGPLKFAQPVVELMFRHENDRVLSALKRAVESGGATTTNVT